MPAPAVPLEQTSNRRVSYKKESTFAQAAGASSAQVLRRTQVNINLKKPAIESQEKRSDFQRADVRHGSRMVDGTLDGELITGAWADFFASLVRRDFAAVSPVAASTGDGFTISTGVLTRAAGGSQSFVTDGLRTGQVVRLANMSTTSVNARNFLITAMTATTLTLAALDGATLADAIQDESASITVVGKTSFVPTTGHTSDSYSIEDYASDTDAAELYVGCRIVGLSMRLQPNNMVTVSWKVMGIDQQVYETSSAPYFTSPTGAGIASVLEAALGYVRLNGAQIAVVTGVNIDVDLGASNTPVVGANVSPDVFYGKAIKVSGQITAYITDHTYLTAFRNETEMELFLLFKAPGNEPRDFFSMFMSRVKLMSADKDDPDTVVSQTLNFEALIKAAATGYESTTLMVQDSSLA